MVRPIHLTMLCAISALALSRTTLAGPFPDRPAAPVAFSPGKCADRTLLRREAGATNDILTPAWLKAHTGLHGRHLVSIGQRHAYTPTSLLKVGGPEQLKQEWIASKGMKNHDRFMAYLRHYA